MKPMLAQSGDGRLPRGGAWTYEVKWDGYRCIATVRDGKATLSSRSGKALWFPVITRALEGLPDCVLDGEAVVLDEAGRSSFGAIGQNSPDARFVAFDLPSSASLPIEERRRLLGEIMSRADTRVATVSPVFDDGEALLAYAEANGLEGLVAKRAGSRYQAGRRSEDWVKVKIRQEQEFAVVGWTPQEGRPGVLGSLVLGVPSPSGGWEYVGKVGTGWSRKAAEKILDRVRARMGEDAPAVAGVKDKDVRWVEPRVVVQVAFQRWTDDGFLWHPSFKGVREDKGPGEVRREA